MQSTEKSFKTADRPAYLLVVDDSRAIRVGISAQLEDAGFRVDTAEDGKAALEKIYGARFDLVLLDVVMPRMDGMRVLNIIRRSYSKLELPIIMTTSRDSANDVAKALDIGANDYITKPIEPIVLKARIENQLLQKQAANYLESSREQLAREVHQRTAQLEEANRRLNYQASYDLLTGLPNRTLAHDRMDRMLREAARQNKEVGVIFMDLDHFKVVNDTLGHTAGDNLLKQAATRLTKCVREIDTVARLGGDEFLLILSQGSAERLDVTPVTTRILSRFAEVFSIDGQEVSTTASLGVAIYPGDGEDVDTLTSNADIAMYQSKSDGRHALSFFSKDLAKGIDRRMQLEAQLRNALGRNELSLHYQPIIQAKHGRTVKFEALLRWQCEALGPVYPDEFIPVAESTGLILPIGGWVLEQVCEKLKDWRARGHKELRAAVNISASQFSQSANLANTIADMLEANGLPPDALEIEITEGLFLHETPAIFNTLQAIREMGIGLSLDDFGTGYSALSYLRRFDFNVLKIDRSFVQDVLTDERDATLVNAIIAMAHGMGLEVVAEGAEEEAHIRFLRERNCDYIQGYFFSRPLPEEAFLAYLNEESKLEKRFPESSFVPLNRVASEKS